MSTPSSRPHTHPLGILMIAHVTPVRRAAFALLLALAAACGDSSTLTPATLTPAALNALSGNNQSGTAGSALSQSLVVQVSTSAGTPVAGVTVTFQVTSGAATLASTSAVT